MVKRSKYVKFEESYGRKTTLGLTSAPKRLTTIFQYFTSIKFPDKIETWMKSLLVTKQRLKFLNVGSSAQIINFFQSQNFHAVSQTKFPNCFCAFCKSQKQSFVISN